jgi:diguanylate cyclase (GGDEF)-like protein/PAS domain S-box-containing protein
MLVPGEAGMSELDRPDIYKSVLENLPSGVYLVDPNRRILFWNAGAEKITGYLRQDVVGRFLREHLLETDDDLEEASSESAETYDPLSVAFRDGKSSVADASILHKQGYRVPIILQTVPIRNERGSVIGVVECFERSAAVSERTRRKALHDLACLDQVTGLPTRRFMESHIYEQLLLSAERRANFCVLLVLVEQIDHLRSTCGPGMIPNMLRVVAQTLENSVRPTDLVGAWSENVFLALLADCPEKELTRVAHRIRKMICRSEVEWWGDRFAVTATLGGAGCRPEDTMELLMERADQSLRENAAEGGHRITAVS